MIKSFLETLFLFYVATMSWASEQKTVICPTKECPVIYRADKAYCDNCNAWNPMFPRKKNTTYLDIDGKTYVLTNKNPTSGSSKPANDSKEICRYYDKPGGCMRGDNCRFRHDIDGKTSITNKSATRRSEKPCRYYDKPGGCMWGDNCHFLHINRPANKGGVRKATSKSSDIPCMNWTTTGSCRFGDGCHFLHLEKISPYPPHESTSIEEME